MAYYCHKCLNEVDLIVTVGVRVGRLDTCVHCNAYLHCCKNCKHYDPGRHNQCKIPEADFIRDREEANFCHHFEIKDHLEAPKADGTVPAAKARLEDVFKKLK